MTMTSHDDDLPVIDESTNDPLWFRYCTWVKDNHDKFYELSIDLDSQGQFVLTRRFGRRPDHLSNGQRKVAQYTSFQGAENMALELYAEKLRKGYQPSLRGW